MRTEHIQNSLNSGELSPLMDLRDDYDRYRSGVELMENFVPLPQGGARTRFGLQFIAQTKDNGVAYLIPFQRSVTQAYMLEVGNLYIRVFRDGGRVSTTADLITNATNNGSGLIRITSVSHGRITNDYVSITGVVGVPAANAEYQVTTIDPDTFDLQGSTFSGTYVSGGTWFAPYEITTPYLIADIPAIKVVQDADTLYLAHPFYAPRKLTSTGHTGFTLSVIDFLDGPYFKANRITPSGALSTITITPSAATGAGITLTASSALWTAEDVGRVVRLLEGSVWGYAKIVGFSSTTVVTADVKLTLTNTNAKTTWRLGAWFGVTEGTAVCNYPSANTIFEQRLCWGGSRLEPQTLWLSTTGSYEDMTPSSVSGQVADSDAVTYVLGSSQINVIRWMLGSTHLFIGTHGEEISLKGADNHAISAINPPLVDSSSAEGSANIQAVRILNQTLFIQRTSRELRTMKFDLISDDNITVEVSIIATHLFDRNITRISYQARPDHTLWMVREDGTWLSFTYYPVEQVQAFARHSTGAHISHFVLDIASIPSVDLTSDQSWYVTQRALASGTRRFIEMQNPLIQVDAGLHYLGPPVTTVTGLLHLEGETVRVVGDGAVYDDQVVTGGSVTLQYGGTVGPAASNIAVGPPIRPDPQITTLPPAYKDANGVVRGRMKHWASLFVSLVDTLGLTINGVKQLQYRKPSDQMDQAPPVFTGDKLVPNLGWSRTGSIIFRQTLPLPASVRGYYGDLNVGD